MTHIFFVCLLTMLTSTWFTVVQTQSLLNALQKTADVYPLIAGRMDMSENAFNFVASITLVQDAGLNIVVDTPTATDIPGKMSMLAGLKNKNLNPSQIEMVVTTHGHPDHFGQDGSFPNAQHFFNNFVYTGNTFRRTTFGDDGLKITPNIKLWQTPGHTPQDVSVIVTNVPIKGTVAIVGDLIFSADDVLNSKGWEQSAWNVTVGIQNRNKIICIADHIIPGHGRPFIVTPQMRSVAQCENRIIGGWIAPVNTNMNSNSVATAATSAGQMKMYPGLSVPLRCTDGSQCVQFPGFTNCVQSAGFNTLVCCSTTSCP